MAEKKATPKKETMAAEAKAAEVKTEPAAATESRPERNIFKALNGVMNEVGAIGKDNKTSGYASFNFRGIDDVYNTLNPLFAKYGVLPVPNILDHTRETRKSRKGDDLLYSIVTVEYTFYALDGTNIKAVVIGEAMDTGDKATNKAMSIAYKYACFQVLCIPTEVQGNDPARVQDPDGYTHEPTRTPHAQREPVVCPKCNGEVKAAKGKSGVVLTAQQVLDELGTCSDCFRAAQENKPDVMTGRELAEQQAAQNG